MSFENLDGKGVALPYTQSLAGWQFISSATTKAFTVEMFDFTGAMVGEFTTASPTVAGFASTLSWTETTGGAAVAWNPLWAGFVVKTTVATSYAKDASGHVPVTAVNGTALAIGMPIGVVPQRLYDAYYFGSGGGGGATAANQTTQIGQASGAVTETTPTFTNATSFTLLASNTARKYLLIQNNSAANILISLSGQTLTGIIPTSSNKGFVIAPGASYSSDRFCPTGAVTGYQTSGGSINTVSIAEG